MKAIEILAESKIDEAPVGMLKQVGRRVGAGVLGALGMKNTAAGIAGKADMGARANQYYTAFRKYLGQTGKDEKTATYQDLNGFLTKSGLDTAPFKGQTGLIDPDVVNQGFTKMAQDYYKGGAAYGAPSRAKTTAPAAGTAQAAPTTAPAAATATPSAPTATGQTASQPFSVPALIQVIPQMNKRDLNRLNKAVQAALQNPAQAAQQAKATAGQAAQTTGMTPAQTRAVKQAAAANTAQAQMKANPAPTPAAPSPAQVRQQKQQAAAAVAQSQMAANPAPAPTASPKPNPVKPAPTAAAPTAPEKDVYGRVEPTLDQPAPASTPKSTIGTAIKPSTPALDRVRSGQATPALNRVRSRPKKAVAV